MTSRRERRSDWRLTFLGTGPAWRAPELGCPCRSAPPCGPWKNAGPGRPLARGTAFDPPGLRSRYRRPARSQPARRPDLILLSHETRRPLSGPRRPRGLPAGPARWRIFAHSLLRHGRLVDGHRGPLRVPAGKLLEKRLAVPGRPLAGLDPRLTITPFKTLHGPSAPGSVGYVIETLSGGQPRKLVYTSDFKDLPQEPAILAAPDLLIAQAHWFNEPKSTAPPT